MAIFAKDVRVANHLDLGNTEHGMPENALDNVSRKTAVSLGAEWILVPFIKEKSNGNIAIRYMLGAETHKYVDPKAFEYIRETFARHTIELYLERHFSKVDVTATASGFASTLREVPLKGIKGTGTVSYRINPRVTLAGTVDLQYVSNRVLSPSEEGTSGSFISLTSDSKTSLFYTGTVSLSYTLGNTRLFNKEQRWKRPASK